MLKNQLVSSGQYLFRWRSYLPLTMVGLFLVEGHNFSYLFGSHAFDQLYDLFCLGVTFLGLGLRVLTVGFVPRGTSGRNTKSLKANTLNTSGMYSIVRHPLYLSNFVIWLGMILFPHHLWMVVVGVLIYWLYYERIMMAEEQFLFEKYGAKYERWASRVPAILPQPSLWRNSELPFSVRAVVRREYTTLFLIITVFTVLELASHYVVDERLFIEPFWASLFGVGLVTYLLARTLKKKSRLLDVQGR